MLCVCSCASFCVSPRVCSYNNSHITDNHEPSPAEEIVVIGTNLSDNDIIAHSSQDENEDNDGGDDDDSTRKKRRRSRFESERDNNHDDVVSVGGYENIHKLPFYNTQRSKYRRRETDNGIPSHTDEGEIQFDGIACLRQSVQSVRTSQGEVNNCTSEADADYVHVINCFCVSDLPSKHNFKNKKNKNKNKNKENSNNSRLSLFLFKKKFGSIDPSISTTELTHMIARFLNERNLPLIEAMINELGVEESLELVRKTVLQEEKGGLMTVQKQPRRRSPGGVLFYLLKELVPEEKQKAMFSSEKVKEFKKEDLKLRKKVGTNHTHEVVDAV